MLVGLDLGFRRVKGYSTNNIFKYLAMIGNPSVFELMQEKKADDPLRELIVGCDEKTYYVGEKALETKNARLCTRPDKTNSAHDKAEYYAALGYLSEKTGETDFTIVTGLPVFEFHLKDTLAKNMKGTKTFKYGADQQDITVQVKKVHVIPQSAGAYFAHILDPDGNVIPERALCLTMVIDIGYRTTDIIMMRNGKYVSQDSFSIEMGMKDIHKELIRAIHAEFGILVNHKEINQICEDRSININGKPVDITRLVNAAAEPVALAIIEGIRVEIPDVRKVDKVLACGGTMELVFDHFLEEYDGHIEKMENCEYSNSEGYYKYGLMIDGIKNKHKAE